MTERGREERKELLGEKGTNITDISEGIGLNGKGVKREGAVRNQQTHMGGNRSHNAIHHTTPCATCFPDQALEKKWHKDCLVCTVCTASFPDGRFCAFKGWPVCPQHAGGPLPEGFE